MIDEKYAEQTPKYVEQTPKKKGHKKLLIIIAVVLFAFIVFAIGAIAAGGSSTTDTAKPQQMTTAPTPKQTQPQQQTPVVGKPYDAGNWQVTVNGTSISMGNEYEHPKAGNQFLIVHVTMKNTSGATQDASSILYWSLKDSAGQNYNQTILTDAKASPDGKVADGGIIAGDMVYEVPASQHSYTVQFTPVLGSDTLVEWHVNV
jgi:Domain of unknown function (DUF4352)